MKGFFLAAAAALALAACATPTSYQPAIANRGQGGYSDMRLSSDRYRVVFQGNTVTNRDTVERYLLYRAAELTRDQGYDWFALADRNTERQSRSYVTNDDPFGYQAWTTVWYYLGNNKWVLVQEPNPVYRPTYERHEINQYRAAAEILLGKGQKPANDTAAFDARDVIANLGPTIVRPEAGA